MRDSTHTDYYQYEWMVVTQRDATVKEKVIFFVLILVLMMMVVGGSFWLNKKFELATYEFFWTLVVFLGSSVGVIGYYWNKILLKNKVIMHKHKIDRNGVIAAGKEIRYGQIDKEKTLERLSADNKNVMKAKNQKNLLVIKVFGDLGERDLEFADVELRNKVAKALEIYLNKQ